MVIYDTVVMFVIKVKEVCPRFFEVGYSGVPEFSATIVRTSLTHSELLNVTHWPVSYEFVLLEAVTPLAIVTSNIFA
jgi:hypothetical protein